MGIKTGSIRRAWFLLFGHIQRVEAKYATTLTQSPSVSFAIYMIISLQTSSIIGREVLAQKEQQL